MDFKKEIAAADTPLPSVLVNLTVADIRTHLDRLVITLHQELLAAKTSYLQRIKSSFPSTTPEAFIKKYQITSVSQFKEAVDTILIPLMNNLPVDTTYTWETFLPDEEEKVAYQGGHLLDHGHPIHLFYQTNIPIFRSVAQEQYFDQVRGILTHLWGPHVTVEFRRNRFDGPLSEQGQLVEMEFQVPGKLGKR